MAGMASRSKPTPRDYSSILCTGIVGNESIKLIGPEVGREASQERNSAKSKKCLKLRRRDLLTMITESITSQKLWECEWYTDLSRLLSKLSVCTLFYARKCTSRNLSSLYGKIIEDALYRLRYLHCFSLTSSTLSRLLLQTSTSSNPALSSNSL